MTSMGHQHIWTVGAIALATLMIASGHAQQPAAAAPGGRAGGASGAPADTTTVLVAGENPAIRKLDKEGGTAVTNVNFWRVHWSPVGAGAVCYVTVTGQPNPADNLRIAIHDQAKVLDYVTKDLMSSLMATFNTPAYTPLQGTITQSGDGIRERRETCKSERYTVELIWRDLGQASWSDIRPGANTLMTFAFVPARAGEILINGKPAPGTWYPTGGGMGTGAYLALNETWRR